MELKEIFEKTKSALIDCFESDFTEAENVRVVLVEVDYRNLQKLRDRFKIASGH